MNEEDVCWDCGKNMLCKKIDYSLCGVSLGKFPARVCESCNEEYFSERVSREITKIVKEKGLPGIRSE